MNRRNIAINKVLSGPELDLAPSPRVLEMFGREK
jgi:hypothetical protein